MTIRASIEIKLENNEIIRYVNSVTQDTLGENGKFYSYSNEDGDKYADQTGPGKAKGDFDSLVGQIGGTGAMTWPEGGTELVRPNLGNSLAAKSEIRKTVSAAKIVSVTLVEQEVNEFQQLAIDRK